MISGHCRRMSTRSSLRTVTISTAVVAVAVSLLIFMRQTHHGKRRRAYCYDVSCRSQLPTCSVHLATSYEHDQMKNTEQTTRASFTVVRNAFNQVTFPPTRRCGLPPACQAQRIVPEYREEKLPLTCSERSVAPVRGRNVHHPTKFAFAAPLNASPTETWIRRKRRCPNEEGTNARPLRARGRVRRRSVVICPFSKSRQARHRTCLNRWRSGVFAGCFSGGRCLIALLPPRRHGF